MQEGGQDEGGHEVGDGQGAADGEVGPALVGAGVGEGSKRRGEVAHGGDGCTGGRVCASLLGVMAWGVRGGVWCGCGEVRSWWWVRRSLVGGVERSMVLSSYGGACDRQ